MGALLLAMPVAAVPAAKDKRAPAVRSPEERKADIAAVKAKGARYRSKPRGMSAAQQKRHARKARGVAKHKQRVRS